jgi:adenosylcobyric acid synthase
MNVNMLRDLNATRTPIMIMGCTSGAGKSFLVAALCRYFSNRRISVAPFKAQNMSNNAAVTPDQLEIGRAQYLQALAARVEPQARMNPVLLKPSADTHSQVIVLGHYSPEITELPWLGRKAKLWPAVRDSLWSLIREFKQVVIEGAGSPAEINLREEDIVNMTVALECKADVYIVSDIDRGGSFAHLLGTWSCMTPEEKNLVKGFVLNRFRGDEKLLGNAMNWLQERTGIHTVATIPMIKHVLPEEDTFTHRSYFDQEKINIALIMYPYASNMDEFDSLINTEGINVVPVNNMVPLDRFRAILLPGSKNTVESLNYLRQTGLAAEITRMAQYGLPVLGICGGMQILGKELLDPENLEGGTMEGLGLLDVTTTLMHEKTTVQREARLVDGSPLRGYEIHHGCTRPGLSAETYIEEDLGWQQGNVRGVYLHGIFDNAAYRQRFLSQLGWDGKARDWFDVIDSELDRISGLMEKSGWGNYLAIYDSKLSKQKISF